MRTGYHLPFSVRYSPGGLLASGGTVAGRGGLRGPVTDPGRAARALQTFADLAATGALAGGTIPPATSALSYDPAQTLLNPLRFDWPVCRVDEAAVVVLANLLLACGEDYPLGGLDLVSGGAPATAELTTDPDEDADYPAAYPNLSFEVEDEQPDGDSVAITAEFRGPLPDEVVGRLRGELGKWFAAVNAGAYAVAPIPPAESYAETDDGAFAAFDATAEWAFWNLRADPACLHGLVNLFAAFHDRVRPLARLHIA